MVIFIDLAIMSLGVVSKKKKLLVSRDKEMIVVPKTDSCKVITATNTTRVHTVAHLRILQNSYYYRMYVCGVWNGMWWSDQ